MWISSLASFLLPSRKIPPSCRLANAGALSRENLPSCRLASRDGLTLCIECARRAAFASGGEDFAEAETIS